MKLLEPLVRLWKLLGNDWKSAKDEILHERSLGLALLLLFYLFLDFNLVALATWDAPGRNEFYLLGLSNLIFLLLCWHSHRHPGYGNPGPLRVVLTFNLPAMLIFLVKIALA